MSKAEALRREMRGELLRNVVWVVMGASLLLALRELSSGGPSWIAGLALLLGAGTLALLNRNHQEVPTLGTVFFCTLVGLITLTTWETKGPPSSALCFAFIPPFLGLLLLDSRNGWGICGLMLTGLGLVYFTSDLSQVNDRLRFIDIVAMTLFAAGLGHSLTRSFAQYETAIEARRTRLEELNARREIMTSAIYERLEPAAQALSRAIQARTQRSSGDALEGLTDLTLELGERLNEARTLAKPDQETSLAQDEAESDGVIRIRAMRTWLRLGAVFMAFFVVRNAWLGAPYLPSIFSGVLCGVYDRWLAKPMARRFLEATALTIGSLAAGSLAVHVYHYAAHADAPPLVVMPSTVLFTALLSQGPATWGVVALNVATLFWVSWDQTLSVPQLRLLTNLGLTFFALTLILSAVFKLRKAYAAELLSQEQTLRGALRQRRRLAGTLFHDVGNHLQVLLAIFEAEAWEELPTTPAIAQRVEQLIDLSKAFLLPGPSGGEPKLESVPVADVLSSLLTVFRPRLLAKQLQIELAERPTTCVRAERELLIESVLGNLLSNAIKFAPPGSTLRLSTRGDADAVNIAIADSGPGIPSEVRQLLTRDGAVPSRVGTRGEPGQGYGLQLAYEHIQRMGGRLELNHRAEGGTEAVVWLHAG
jgi:signal transduction histidine kinase